MRRWVNRPTSRWPPPRRSGSPVSSAFQSSYGEVGSSRSARFSRGCSRAMVPSRCCSATPCHSRIRLGAFSSPATFVGCCWSSRWSCEPLATTTERSNSSSPTVGMPPSSPTGSDSGARSNSVSTRSCPIFPCGRRRLGSHATRSRSSPTTSVARQGALQPTRIGCGATTSTASTDGVTGHVESSVGSHPRRSSG